MKYIPNGACLGTMTFGEFLVLTSDFIPYGNRMEMYPSIKQLCDEAKKESPTSLGHCFSSDLLRQALSSNEAARIVTLRFHGDTANVYVQDSESGQEIGLLYTGLAQRIFEKWRLENP